MEEVGVCSTCHDLGSACAGYSFRSQNAFFLSYPQS